MHPYQLDPTTARPCTVTLTPRQWTRILLDPCSVLSDHLMRSVRAMLAYTEDYPEDLVPASATPRESAFIAALIRDYQTRGY